MTFTDFFGSEKIAAPFMDNHLAGITFVSLATKPPDTVVTFKTEGSLSVGRRGGGGEEVGRRGGGEEGMRGRGRGGEEGRRGRGDEGEGKRWGGKRWGEKRWEGEEGWRDREIVITVPLLEQSIYLEALSYEGVIVNTSDFLPSPRSTTLIELS